MGLNAIDLGIVLVLAAFAFLGTRRGFLVGTSDIVGAVVAFLIAIRIYAPASAWLAGTFGWPPILVNFATLFAIFIAGEWLFALLASPILRLARRYLLRGEIAWMDSMVGVIPGLVKGITFAAALVAMFALFPLQTDVRASVYESTLGARLLEAVSAAAPGAETFLGGSRHDTALFVTQPAAEEGPRRLSFPADLSLREDAGSERAMLTLLNQERLRAGLGPLSLDQRVQAVARAHSVDMFRQGYFAHESPAGDSPADRVRKAGIPFLMMGENLAYAPNVSIAHTGLMNSPGHRANILTPGFTRVGIGVIDGGLYGKMFTQNFTN